MNERAQAEQRARRRLGRGIAIVFGSLLCVLLGFALWQRHALLNIARSWEDFSDGSALARELRGPDDMLRYIADHAADVSLVAYRIGEESGGIFLQADRPRPLAAAPELLLVCEYSRAFAEGAQRPDAAVPIADWEAYWLPELDGGAHERALAALRETAYVAAERVQLQDLVYAMLRFGDSAAADYLMQRLGRSELQGLPVWLGLPAHTPLLPVSGMFLSWQNSRRQDTPAQLIARYGQTPDAYADEVFRLTAAMRDDPKLRAAERARLRRSGLRLGLREQASLVRALAPRGSARDYARLLARLAAGELPESDAIRQPLVWPLDRPELSERFSELGSKTGSLPGMLSSLSFATPRGGSGPRVVALFMEAMPMAVWLELMNNSARRRFEHELLADDAFFERARQVLATRAP